MSLWRSVCERVQTKLYLGYFEVENFGKVVLRLRIYEAVDPIKVRAVPNDDPPAATSHTTIAVVIG